MFDNNYAYEEIMRLRREDLDAKMKRRARYNLYPENEKEIRKFRKISMFLMFFRNAIMK